MFCFKMELWEYLFVYVQNDSITTVRGSATASEDEIIDISIYFSSLFQLTVYMSAAVLSRHSFSVSNFLAFLQHLFGLISAVISCC